MSCAPGPGRYRLLDSLVGWDPADVDGLIGLDGGGLELAPVGQDQLDLDALAPYIPPPRLARGCGPCDWYLATTAPPPGRILRHTGCDDGWTPLWRADLTGRGCGGPAPVEPVAVAASEHRLAVVDAGRARVDVWAREGEQLVASIPVDDPSAAAFAPSGDVWVIADGGRRLAVHDPSGLWRYDVDPGLNDPIQRLAFGPSPGASPDQGCKLWLVTVGPSGAASLWQAETDGSDPVPATLDELVRSLTPNGLVAADDRGFCLDWSDGGERCFDWYGRPVDPSAIHRSALVPLVEQGQLITVPIDSGVPRCQWHRVRIDADVPRGTSLAVSVSSSEVADPPPQGQVAVDPGWDDFEPGVPHPADWQILADGNLDALVGQPPGRYLFVRVRLHGDGAMTPTVRRIRLDFPRSTSLDSLPAIYRSDPAAAEFTERFLSLFDAELEHIDGLVERHPALLDPAAAPPEVLAWLAELVGMTFAPEWDLETRRALVAAAPELYRTRGTVDGLRSAVALVFGVDPAVDEIGPTRPWGALAAGGDGATEQGSPLAARLRQVRLFGRSRSRLRLGTSALGRTAIKSFGNPDDDPRNSGAYRIRISLPSSGSRGPIDRVQARDLVAAVSPAHVVADVRFGGDGFFVGTAATVGIDTTFAPLPAPVLGETVHLRRRTVLWPSRRGPAPGISLDGGAVVGHTTYME